MSNIYEPNQAWKRCNYCESTEFSEIKFFMRHLREKHCRKEGGSFVCHYGENNVCSSLPVEGVSDADYERHVYKHHTFTMPFTTNHRKISTGSIRSDKQSSLENKWTIYSAAQNLPAVLNDPNKGKQKDLFTKTWGDHFVEVSEVPEPHYFPHITIHHFEHYLKKIVKRHKKHMKLNALAPKPHTHADLLQTFPNLRIGKPADKNHFDISVIPRIFLHPAFDLSNKDTFNAVYTHTLPTSNNNTNETCFEPTASNSAKLLQEKLTHYLDMVEVQIAQQVASKSDAFFHAMTSHDVLMEQLGQTIAVVKNLREKINKIDNGLVKDSLNILKLERSRSNHQQVYRKLKVMSTVMQAQPTIKLLLSSPDYVGALDLIQTTQDLLMQDLAGIHSFRHLSSELSEMLKVIDTLMAEEFERYTTADLNRPLDDAEDPEIVEREKLSCIVMGMLRRENMSFVDAYRNETIAAVKAAVKQAVIEVVAGSDSSHHLGTPGDSSLEDQLKALPVEEWATLLSNATTALLRLLLRVKKGHDIMINATNICAGKLLTERDNEDLLLLDSTDWQLSDKDHEKVINKIRSLLVYICEYSQDRCAQLLSSRSLMWPEEKSKEDGKMTTSSPWIAERANLTQLRELANHVDIMTKGCESICPGASIYSLKSAFNRQATKFMVRFHSERLNKLLLILDAEPWRQTDVPATFQQLVDHIADKGTFSINKSSVDIRHNGESKLESFLFINNEKFAVVGAVLILVNIVAEYCVHAEDCSLSAEVLLRYLNELLTQFNSRCSKLMLGAEAVSEKTGLKKITSTNLALLLRALQLLLWLLPHVDVHFQGLIGESTRNYLKQVSEKVKDHARDVNAKLLEIMNNLIILELKHWEAKPPAPSKPFQNICKHMIKFNEAIANILPQEQVQELYKSVNSRFKECFSDRLQKMNIVNNGGPQHGLVITELTFYLEDLKKVTALPPETLELSTMNDIWIQRASR